MKKTFLLSAILLGMSTSAMATTSVTLYGTIDAGFNYTNSKEQLPKCEGSLTDLTVWPAFDKIPYSCTTTKTTDREYALSADGKNSTKLGFKGSRDFGMAVEGIFQVEVGLDLTNNTGNGIKLMNGFVGINSVNWGTLTIGQQNNAFDTLAVGGAMDGLEVANYFDGVTGSDVKPGIKYVTPQFFGLQLALSWAGTNTYENDGDVEKVHDNFYSAGVAYSLAGLNVSAGIYDNYRSTTRGKEYSRFSWMVGANYDFGPVAVYARYAKVSQSYVANFIDSELYKKMQDASSADTLINEATRLTNELNNSPTVKEKYEAYMKQPAGQRGEFDSQAGSEYSDAYHAVFNDYNDKYQAFAKTVGAAPDPSFQMISVGLSAPLGDNASLHFEWQHGSAKDLATGNAYNLGIEGNLTDGLTLYAAVGYSHIKNKSGKIYNKTTGAKVGLSYDF